MFESLHFNSPRRSISYIVSDHHYDSDDTPWDSGDDEDLTPLGFIPPDNKLSPATPPPSPSCLLLEDLAGSVPIFREPPNQRDILAISTGAVATAFLYCTETLPPVEDHIIAPIAPHPPCLTSNFRPGHQLTPSSHYSTAFSSSENSIFILPAIPRLYYSHSSTNCSNNWCNLSSILTNPLNRLKARKRSVKESAAMNAELGQVHAEMRRTEILCREGLV